MTHAATGAANAIPFHMRGRREKCFGDGRPVPLGGKGKARVMARALALMRRAEAGRHYGPVTAKALAVLKALLFGFHNCHSGRCFPSYERIAEKADCARSTVAEAIKTLEALGILSWVNRIVRVRVGEPDLFGRIVGRWRVLRTSNAYSFVDPEPSKSDLPTGTPNQVFKSSVAAPDPRLAAALERWGEVVRSGAPSSGAGLIKKGA